MFDRYGCAFPLQRGGSFEEDRYDRRIRDSKRWRLLIIAVVGSVLVGLPMAAHAVGSRRANYEVARIRQKAPSVLIDKSRVAFHSYAAGNDDPIASALGINDGRVSIAVGGNTWCVGIEIRRLLATRRLTFLLTDRGELTETRSCREK
jgi:hypothetical protein